MTVHVPVVGSWVRLDGEDTRLGRIEKLRPTDSPSEAEVDWGGRRAWHALSELRSGIRPGFVVQDSPASSARHTLGPGTVRSIRRLAGRDQALVQLHETGHCVWLPAENLVRIRDTALCFAAAETLDDSQAERTALRLMAHGLRSWNEITGALDRLDVDPLPHQIQLVHRILSSNHCNWLIADDVGLGKTIEVGLLLAGLHRQGRARRVLIVCPAGLTRQWQEEMKTKFQKEYRIYGRDFTVDEEWKWKFADHVIISLDLAKPRSLEDVGDDFRTPFGALRNAGRWDIIIFDEAHRLNKADDGELTLRFRLARELRQRTDSLLCLTGTPHQGDTGRFRNLLHLVRDDLAQSLSRLEFEPDVVGEIVLRNRKIDVTDAAGDFIFKGHEIRRVPVASSPETVDLDRNLLQYFQYSLFSAKRKGAIIGRAVGFVITTYRKLASSSLYALRLALERRLDRLRGATGVTFSSDLMTDDGSSDYQNAQTLVDSATPFFADEAALLVKLVERIKLLEAKDAKLQKFIELIRELRTQGKKVLVFTEYRATQDILIRALSDQPNKITTTLINGSLLLEDKLSAVAAFENEADVLVSTEAGGEGLNLHRRCHILINYDLPWNPARLIQRIGRVYRYGQEKKVLIINLQMTGTIDASIIDQSLAKIERMAAQMAKVNDEFKDVDVLKSEIMGELLEQLELEELLERIDSEAIERTPERIDAAIERARAARERQDELLSFSRGFDAKSFASLQGLTPDDAREFVVRMAPFADIEVLRAGAKLSC
jgi:ERCC4-related helicase